MQPDVTAARVPLKSRVRDIRDASQKHNALQKMNRSLTHSLLSFG
jgi:hypothetical protein